MMEAKTLPPKYWAEAINYVAYIQNRVPHKQLDGMTHFEAWSGEQARCDPFLEFCLKGLGYNSNRKEEGFAAQSQECLFF